MGDELWLPLLPQHRWDKDRGPKLDRALRWHGSLADGSTVTVDEEYIRESILSPNAKVVQGFAPGLMPAQFIDPVTKKPISDEQIADLIAYANSVCR